MQIKFNGNKDDWMNLLEILEKRVEEEEREVKQ